LQHFINNENVPSVSGKVFKNINPSTEEKIGDVAEGEKVRNDLEYSKNDTSQPY